MLPLNTNLFGAEYFDDRQIIGDLIPQHLPVNLVDDQRSRKIVLELFNVYARRKDREVQTYDIGGGQDKEGFWLRKCLTRTFDAAYALSKNEGGLSR